MSHPTDHIEELQQLIDNLLLQPEHEQVASEIQVLQSIYGDDAVRTWHPPANDSRRRSEDVATIRYEVSLSLPSPHEDVAIRVLVSLPPTYPVSSPPQLQLLSRYIGAFAVDSGLFGSILRTFISITGIEWTADTVCVFDGLQNVLERCLAWYEDHLSADVAGELAREDSKDHNEFNTTNIPAPDVEKESPKAPLASMPAGIQIFVADAILDRKSSFVGRACRVSHPSEVPLVLSHLSSDKRISRAAHPIINAWRCQVGAVIHQDNDDDGETAAGGRLAHLLQILEVNNVLVVVTRYFGGIHLGPDRFKHINQAARNALEIGGFLEEPGDSKKSNGRAKKH
ncbi:imprinted and ancient [Infundibulicybe gibba]|nr:imprinted and ancient [Infundibulicybe gibba]